MKVLLDLAKVAPWGIMKVLLDTILVTLGYHESSPRFS